MVLVVSFISVINGVRRAQGHLQEHVAYKTEASYRESKMPPPVSEFVRKRKRNFSDNLERKRKLKL